MFQVSNPLSIYNKYPTSTGDDVINLTESQHKLRRSYKITSTIIYICTGILLSIILVAGYRAIFEPKTPLPGPVHEKCLDYAEIRRLTEIDIKSAEDYIIRKVAEATSIASLTDNEHLVSPVDFNDKLARVSLIKVRIEHLLRLNRTFAANLGEAEGNVYSSLGK